MTLLCACGRQWRRLHCGSSRASERRQRPPPPAPYQPRTPALSARPAPFHPPRGGAALLTARHHLRRRPPRPWPVGPARSCAWRGSRAPPCAGRRRARRRRLCCLREARREGLGASAHRKRGETAGRVRVASSARRAMLAADRVCRGSAAARGRARPAQSRC